jgi:hypothetical protein
LKALIFLLSILLLFTLIVIAEEGQMTQSEALKLMDKHLDKQEHELIGIRPVYPCGYGLPGFVGFFKVNSNNSVRIIRLILNSEKKIRESERGDSAGYYDVTVQFLNPDFIKSKVKELTGQSVATLYLVKCGGKNCFVDCLNISGIFWMVFLEDGEEYLFDFSLTGWYLAKAAEVRAKYFKDFKPFIEGDKK